jgi:hypothetical protein
VIMVDFGCFGVLASTPFQDILVKFVATNPPTLIVPEEFKMCQSSYHCASTVGDLNHVQHLKRSVTGTWAITEIKASNQSSPNFLSTMVRRAKSTVA